MPSMHKITEYFRKSHWILETLESMMASGNIDTGIEMNNVERIMKTNRASYSFLNECMAGKKAGPFSFWVTKRTVDMDFKTVSKMVARKQL